MKLELSKLRERETERDKEPAKEAGCSIPGLHLALIHYQAQSYD